MWLVPRSGVGGPVGGIHATPVTVTANGREVPWTEAASLTRFLEQQGLRPRSVVVELNGEAVAPSEFDGRTVRPGDRLEIVQIVAGG
ncbi:MAG: sulfur carrier protein ThiS [Verrucomicrobia bacterium]|nr:sulfur carrier protein ThiS [Verrucomicrobiota bacterium]